MKVRQALYNRTWQMMKERKKTINKSGINMLSDAYTMMTVGTFALAVVLEKEADTTILTTDLKGLSKSSPYLAFSLSVLLFSLAGLPPSIGFFGKFYVFSATIEQGFYWLTFVGVLSSIISVYYYLRPVVVMYMVEGEGFSARKEAVFSKAIVVISAIGVCALGVMSSRVFRFVQSSITESL